MIQDIHLVSRDPERSAVPFLHMLNRKLPDIRIFHQKLDNVDNILAFLCDPHMPCDLRGTLLREQRRKERLFCGTRRESAKAPGFHLMIFIGIQGSVKLHG